MGCPGKWKDEKPIGAQKWVALNGTLVNGNMDVKNGLPLVTGNMDVPALVMDFFMDVQRRGCPGKWKDEPAVQFLVDLVLTHTHLEVIQRVRVCWLAC